MLSLLSLFNSGNIESTIPYALFISVRKQREYREYTNYINNLMPTPGISCLNHFIARLFSLGIIIIFYLPRCLSPAYILRRTPNIYP